MNDNMKIKYFDEELEVYDERRVVNKNTYSITLNYVPSPTRPLTVENGKTTLTETNGTPNANQYVLDRENGLLLFNQAMKGKVMTINYSAIGLWCISADKVYTNVDNKGEIIETLEDLMRENRQSIESIKTVGDASVVITQLQANIDSVTGLADNIAEGLSVNEELTQNIESGEVVNTTLTNTISNANNKINEMNTWVNQHGDIVNLDNRVNAVEAEIPRINEKLEETNIKIDNNKNELDTKINSNIEATNVQFKSINTKIDGGLHDITTNRDSINEIRVKMVTREDINSITHFDITEMDSMLKVNEGFNNIKVLLSNGIVNFNCRLDEKTQHNNIPFNQILFKIPIEFLPNCSYMFLDCKYGLYGKSPTFSGTVKVDCKTGNVMLESDGNTSDGVSITYIGAITIQATWYIDKNIGTGYKLITQNSNSRISYHLNQTLLSNDFIYYTYMNSDNHNVINKCNKSGDVIESKVLDEVTTDNHGILSIAIDKNGYIHLMGGGHSDFNNYYYRSTTPHSVSNFLKIQLSNSRKTYCHIFTHENKILGAYRETSEVNTNKDRIVYFEAPINVESLGDFKFVPLTVVKDGIQPSYPFNVYSDNNGIFINFGWYLNSQDKTPKILSIYKNHNNTLWKKVGGEGVTIPVDDTLYSISGDDLCSTSWIKDGNKYICLFFDRNIGQVMLRTFEGDTISDKTILENQTLLPLNIVRYKGYVLAFVYDLTDNYSYLIITNNSFETYRKICLFETGYTQWWNTISTTNQESNTMIPYLSLYNLSKLWLNIVE